MRIMSPFTSPVDLTALYAAYKQQPAAFFALPVHHRRMLVRRLHESSMRASADATLTADTRTAHLLIDCLNTDVCAQSFTSPTCLIYHMNDCFGASVRLLRSFCRIHQVRRRQQRAGGEQRVRRRKRRIRRIA